MYDEFQKRNTVVIAVAKEDTDLETHGKMLARFEGTPSFELAADLDDSTKRYERTAVYYIDSAGVVGQVFPSTIRHRPSWQAVLNEIDRIQSHTSN
jgi:hypothetical protein